MLRPEHIGEPLISALFIRLKEIGRVGHLVCRNLRNGDEVSFTQVLSINNLGLDFSSHDNVSLVPIQREEDPSSYAFDGMSQVDCAIACERVFPIEVKLGTTRMAAGEFGRRFLAPCCFTKHVPPRVCGNMIAVLDGRFEDQTISEVPLRVELDEGNQVLLTLDWGLVVRREVFDHWARNSSPVMNRTCWIILFEDFVQAVGGADAFDSVVKDLVGYEFADAWGMI